MEITKILTLKNSGTGLKKIIFISILTVCFAGIAYAKKEYQNYVATQYPNSPFATECSICHIPDPQGSPGKNNVNLYGTAWKNAGRTFAALAVIENQDSDGDGFKNLDEIQAGSSPGDPNDKPAVQVNEPPVANAGVDQSVDAGTVVTLDGSGSSDPDDGIASYSWSQTAGTTVALSGSTSASPTFNASSPGSLTFTLTVTDSGGLQSSDTVIVTVNRVNAAPTANAGPDQTVNEGDAVTLNGSNSSDPDDGIASYSWSQTAGTTVTLAGSVSASPTFTASSPGSLTFTLTVTDFGGLQSTDTVIVTVNQVNAAPTADAGANQTVNEGDAVTLNGSNSSDPDNGIASYQWTQTSGTSVSLSNPASVSPTFTAPSTAGTLTFSLTVTDAGGLQSSDTCTVTVNQVNAAPTADAGANQTVNEGDAVTLNGSNSSDPDDGIASYQWTQTSGTSVLLLNPSSVSATFTAPSVTGSLIFQLTVTDISGLQASDTCIVNVAQGNQPPTADAGPDQTVDEGAAVTLNGSNSSDPDDGITSYSWTQISGTSVALSDSGAVNPSFTAPSKGPLTFQLTVTDAGGLQADARCIINIIPANIAPTAEAGVDQTVGEGVVVTLNGSNSADPDGGIVSYLWTQTEGTPVTLSDPGAVDPSFTAPAEGSLAFTLQVTDAGGLQDTDTCLVNVVWINQPPTADAGMDQTVYEGAEVNLNGSNSSDPDDGIVSYLWTQTEGTAVTLSDPAIENPTFTAGNTGALTFNLKVTDAGGLQANDTCTVNVAAENQPPTADAGMDQTVDEGAVVKLNGINSADPDDGIVSYQWTQTAGTTVTLSDPSSVSPTFTAPATGPLNFMLTVTDAGGLQANDTCIINIKVPANNAPVADAGADQTVNEGETVVLDGSGSADPDLDAISYLWTQTAGTAVTLSDPAAVAPDFTAPLEGSLTFRLTVTDARGLQHSDLCIINIVHVNDPPVASAGADQSVQEGDTVVLDASPSSDADDGIAAFQWNQTGGPSVTLSDPTDFVATFVAPPVKGADIILVFELTVTDNGGLQSTAPVSITVKDNGITLFPDNVTSMMSKSDMPIGITVDSGGSCTSLTTVDPVTLPDDPGTPDNFIYGLINFRIKVAKPGDTAVVTIYLSDPAPEDYSWYKYNDSTGWIDFSDNAVFSDDRSQITITITDGGPGDDDRSANGEIVDPSGLGFMSTPSYSVSPGGGDFGSGGGCFISTLKDSTSKDSTAGSPAGLKDVLINKYNRIEDIIKKVFLNSKSNHL